MLQVHWLVPMVLYILVAYVGIRWATKHIVGKHSRTKRLFLNYLFCMLFAMIFAAALGHMRWNTMTAIIILVGFGNGFACYAHWKAIDVSLSKTALFTFWDDLIAMGLSYVILKEGKFIDATIGTGIALCIIATILFALHAYKRKESLAFFWYTAFYSVLWGIAIFFERFSAFNSLPVGQFLSSWYIGAFIAASLLVLFYKDPDASQQENEEQLTAHDVLFMFVYAFGIAFCLGIRYWVYSLAPQVVTQPVFLVMEAVVPAMVGWIIFQERKTFDTAQWSYTAMGLTGVFLLAVGF